VSDAAADLAAARRQQRLEALEVSKRNRRENKLLKDAMRAKRVDPFALLAGTIGDVMDDQRLAARLEEVVTRWPIERALRAVPSVGPTRAAQIIAAFRASPKVRVGQLSMTRRDELARLVRAATDTTALGV
jgi:hypothetical protein